MNTVGKPFAPLGFLCLQVTSSSKVAVTQDAGSSEGWGEGVRSQVTSVKSNGFRWRRGWVSDEIEFPVGALLHGIKGKFQKFFLDMGLRIAYFSESSFSKFLNDGAYQRKTFSKDLQTF